MLYYIFRYLEQFDIPGSGMWEYISFRAILALILSLVISIWFGEWFIKYMRRANHVEEQRDRSIDPFGVMKKGVPTMGGIIIIVATLVPVLLFGRLRNIYLLLMVVTLVWMGLLGFWDDYTKMHKTKDGIRPLWKLAGQFLLGLGVGLTLFLSPDAVIRENVAVKRAPAPVVAQGIVQAERQAPDREATAPVETVMLKSERVKSTKTTLPFVKNHNLDYAGWFGWLGDHAQTAGWIFFIAMATFIIMAVSNGANLNDGLDGMCAGNSAIICVALGILAYFSSHIEYASYFNIMYIPDSQELVVFIAAFVGALVGFLWYNAYPAQIFMGDTGSLAIGGVIGSMAVCIHKELLVPVLCFIFLIESISVLLQTNYARYGNRRGQKLRVFKRSPIHDTFRIPLDDLPADFRILLRWPRGAWHEVKVTTRFWIITIITAALAILTLKIR